MRKGQLPSSDLQTWEGLSKRSCKDKWRKAREGEAYHAVGLATLGLEHLLIVVVDEAVQGELGRILISDVPLIAVRVPLGVVEDARVIKAQWSFRKVAMSQMRDGGTRRLFALDVLDWLEGDFILTVDWIVLLALALALGEKLLVSHLRRKRAWMIERHRLRRDELGRLLIEGRSGLSEAVRVTGRVHFAVSRWTLLIADVAESVI